MLGLINISCLFFYVKNFLSNLRNNFDLSYFCPIRYPDDIHIIEDSQNSDPEILQLSSINYLSFIGLAQGGVPDHQPFRWFRSSIRLHQHHALSLERFLNQWKTNHETHTSHIRETLHQNI